jgi:hypothetical protein
MTLLYRHSDEGRNLFLTPTLFAEWVPAFAGMTDGGLV